MKHLRKGLIIIAAILTILYWTYDGIQTRYRYRQLMEEHKELRQQIEQIEAKMDKASKE